MLLWVLCALFVLGESKEQVLQLNHSYQVCFLVVFDFQTVLFTFSIVLTARVPVAMA
jgi:hypothetical protein